ncbi:MAG: haloacid dehalogenase [Bacteroidetes bacterium CG12_big_fil_rev_8_21_14_0_65_60_17]|nr:MAG: haloacid dehalogenase [Bacteroidetes bacterium CG12_big_fil_rev_8_21_14_0_65_60_17]
MFIVFDIDGTLMLTRGVGREAIGVALENELGRPVLLDEVSFSGRTDPAILVDVLRASGVPEDEIPGLLPGMLQAYESELCRRLQPRHVDLLPGVMTLVNLLRRREGTYLGILTGNLEGTARAKLKAAGMEGIFGTGAYGSDDQDRNLLPAIARARLQRAVGVDVPPQRTVIIGDTEHDIACSRAHGAWALAVCTGHVSRALLEQNRPDLLLDSLHPPEAVLAFIDGLTARD